jgi:hypothetical protein
MVTTTVDAEQTWRLLWSHTASQIISALPAYRSCEATAVGYGWGLRHTRDPRRAILLHPTAEGREIGDLSLTVCGKGSQIIPRCNSDFIRYLHAVTDAVETVANTHLLE